MSEQVKKTWTNTNGVTMSLLYDTETDDWIIKAESPDEDTLLDLPSLWTAMLRIARNFEVLCDFYDDYAYFTGFHNENHARNAFRHLGILARLHEGGAA